VTRAYRHWLYLVEPQVITIPEWAQVLQPAEFDRDPMKAWLPRFAAKIIKAEDAELGGACSVIKTEFRRCPVCRRLTIHLLAEKRRLLDRGYTGKQKTCGPDCQERANGCGQ
jgi:hypothetical protein